MWRTLIPQDAPDSDAPMGIPVGPPSLSALTLPLAVEVRLHNHLVARRLFTVEDVKKRRPDVMSAIMATFKVDVQHIVDLYLNPSASP